MTHVNLALFFLPWDTCGSVWNESWRWPLHGRFHRRQFHLFPFCLVAAIGIMGCALVRCCGLGFMILTMLMIDDMIRERHPDISRLVLLVVTVTISYRYQILIAAPPLVSSNVLHDQTPDFALRLREKSTRRVRHLSTFGYFVTFFISNFRD